VFERFSEPARLVVVYAQEEARGLGHQHIGAEHLLLGVVRVETAILPAGLDDVRARIGKGPGTWPGQIPFTSGARSTLERSVGEATALGHEHIVPAHLLLGLADEPEAVLASGATSERIRAAAMRRLASSPPPAADLDAAHAELLLAMLAKDGRAAALLREHGLDEAVVRDWLGP
jgi:ATP-dependent Clp protease ATP-binding subunit ClpA